MAFPVVRKGNEADGQDVWMRHNDDLAPPNPQALVRYVCVCVCELALGSGYFPFG